MKTHLLPYILYCLCVTLVSLRADSQTGHTSRLCRADSSRRIPQCGGRRKLPPVLRPVHRSFSEVGSRAKDGSEGWPANRSSKRSEERRLVRPGVFTDNELRAKSEFGAPRQYQAAPPVSGLLKNAFFRSSRGNEAQISLETIIRLEPPYAGCCFFNGRLAGEVEIRAAYEIMAARAAQLALFVESSQFLRKPVIRQPI